MSERKEIHAVSEQKNLGQKIRDAFVPEDVSNIGLYILTDWIVPAAWDFIQSGINSMIPKTGGGKRTSGPSNITGKPTKIANISSQFAYHKIYDEQNRREREDIGDFSTILIPDRADAELVLQEMRDVIGDPEYGGDGKVSIGWFFDRCGIHPIPAAAWNWGWRDLRFAKVERYNSGYRIAFPRAVNLR